MYGRYMGRHRVVITHLRVDGDAIYARGLVASETHEGVWYETRVIIDRIPIGGTHWVRIVGKCTCPAGTHGRACKHLIWLANKAIARVRTQQSRENQPSGPSWVVR